MRVKGPRLSLVPTLVLARSRSPPFLRRSSRLKRRRVDYAEGSDIDIDLRAKSSSHEDKDGLYSDIEQESDQSYGAQTDTAEFSSQEDSVPDAYAKAPVKAKATPLVPTFTEADLIFPLTQPDDLKLAVLFAASIQVAQLQTLVYYSKDARNDEGQEIVYFHPLPQENHAKYAERDRKSVV